MVITVTMVMVAPGAIALAFVVAAELVAIGIERPALIARIAVEVGIVLALIAPGAVLRAIGVGPAARRGPGLPGLPEGALFAAAAGLSSGRTRGTSAAPALAASPPTT